MDEIFGEVNFRNVVIVRRGIKSVQAQFETVGRLNFGAEYLLIYSRHPGFRFDKLEVAPQHAKPGSWNNHWRGTERPTMRYPLFGQTPNTGQWRWGEARSLAAIENYAAMLQELGGQGSEPAQEDIDAWWLKKLQEIGEELDL